MLTPHARALVLAPVFIIPCALAQNLETILVSRFLLGVAGSTGSTLVGGSLADIWRSPERGLPMSCFAAAALLGIGASSALTAAALCLA